MRKNLILFAVLVITVSSQAQLTVQSGATFFIQSGATVTVQGDVTSSADIQGTGTLLMKGSSLQNLNMNGFSIANLQIDNANNVSLGGAAQINNSATFTTGKVQLNGFSLTLGSTATLSGFDNSRYFITNSTGQLIRNGLGATAFTFPVGFDGSSYNPLTVTQNGTADNIGVRVLQNVQTAGGSGAAMVKEVVDASWAITETVAGGSNLTVQASWNGTDELTGFNRAKTGLSFFDGTTWDMTNAMTGAASGTGPYTVSRSAITATGVFAVGTRPVLTPLLVSPKVFLQGPAFASGLMSDGLRIAGVIPTTEPYTALGNYTQSGSGGAESIPSSALTVQPLVNNNIVDWVFLQLHNGTTGAVVATRSALVERDGDIVDMDGTNTKTNFVNFAGELPGNYYVSVRHRNHLGVRTAAAFALNKTTATSYDFTTALTQAFPGAVANDPMATLAPGVFGMWGGDANGNGVARKTGSSTVNDYLFLINYLGSNSILAGVYRREDFNMDGTVRKTGSSTVNDYLRLIALLGVNSIVTQPAF